VIRSLGSTPLATWPTSARGWLALREGDLDAAEAYAEEAAVLSESADLDWRRLVARLFAEIAILRGEPEAALQALQPYVHLEDWEQDAAFLETLAWTYLENGHARDAEDTALRAVQEARGRKYRTDLPAALAVAGKVMTELGRWDEARAYIDEALDLARGMRLPFEEARSLLARGVLLRQRGSTDEARFDLDQALATFGRLGARKDQERTEAEIGRIEAS
jgi:tetratricopeptide (TPR) repeat protein